jgi:hypothetical protein
MYNISFLPADSLNHVGAFKATCVHQLLHLSVFIGLIDCVVGCLVGQWLDAGTHRPQGHGTTGKQLEIQRSMAENLRAKRIFTWIVCRSLKITAESLPATRIFTSLASRVSWDPAESLGEMDLFCSGLWQWSDGRMFLELVGLTKWSGEW